MNNFAKLATGVLIGSFVLTACVKKTKEEDNDTNSAAENFLATMIANDMGNIADEAGRTRNVSSFRTTGEMAIVSSCATLTFDSLSNANPDTITVNFGNSNCQCNDGRNRRGALIVVYNGRYKDSLTTITITPKNYFVNDNGVSGSKTVQNFGHNAQGHLIYDISEDITVSKAGGSGQIEFTAKRTREWLSGESTLVWNDDRYSITGTASGVNANGRSFVSNITKPLIRDMSLGCRRNFISGVIEHTPLEKPARVLDFGNGECDNQATVTINGKTYTITLP